jgi:hypothetical protein
MKTTLGLTGLMLMISAAAWGQDGGVEETPAVAPEPVSRGLFDALAAEVRSLKENLALPAPSYESFSGMGPAASKVYFNPHGLSLGGYGEAYYRFRPGPEPTGETDLERIVLYVGYRFTDRIVFNSEIEFEHASTERAGAVNVEFAYLDFKLFDALSVRVGSILMPMGFTNEIHEPPFRFGVARPVVEHDLIPATWNENAVGVYGEYKGLRYRAYLVNGMQALAEGKNEGFGASEWIRGGRQGSSEVIAHDVAGVGSVEFTFNSLRVGASAYFGSSGQGRKVDDVVVRGQLFLGETHVAFQHKGFWLRGLLAYGSLGDADRISAANGSTVGKEVLGGYAEAAYDVLTLLNPGGEQSLSPFVRYESLDTHKSVASDGTREAAQSRQLITAGLHYKPIVNVVLKADYQQVFPGAGSPERSLNVGVGFVF